MNINLRCIPPLLFCALAAAPSQARAQRWPRPNGELARVCLLNPDGTGQFSIAVNRLVAQVLTAALPGRFSVVEQTERCDDGIDNNCSGEIDENCDQAPDIWGAGADCDACMAQSCSVFSQRCDDDQACQDAIDCALQAKCLDLDLGPISCFCGEGVSIEACQDSTIAELDGACMSEFAASVVPSWIPAPETGGVLAGKMLLCMTRQCADRCSENFYNAFVDESSQP